MLYIEPNGSLKVGLEKDAFVNKGDLEFFNMTGNLLGNVSNHSKIEMLTIHTKQPQKAQGNVINYGEIEALEIANLQGDVINYGKISQLFNIHNIQGNIINQSSGVINTDLSIQQDRTLTGSIINSGTINGNIVLKENSQITGSIINDGVINGDIMSMETDSKIIGSIIN